MQATSLVRSLDCLKPKYPLRVIFLWSQNCATFKRVFLKSSSSMEVGGRKCRFSVDHTPRRAMGSSLKGSPNLFLDPFLQMKEEFQLHPLFSLKGSNFVRVYVV